MQINSAIPGEKVLQKKLSQTNINKGNNSNNRPISSKATISSRSPFKQSQMDDGFDPDAVLVVSRSRPLSQKEINQSNPKLRKNILKKQDNMIFIMDPEITEDINKTTRKQKSFVFDYVFDENDSNIEVYNTVCKPLVIKLLQGFNSTIFAYGMTGAGKSYTMIGDLSKPYLLDGEEGITLQVVKDVFKCALSDPNFKEFDFVFNFSYLEIYNEQIKDLLVQDGSNLMLMEDPQKGMIVSDLTEKKINSVDELIQLILEGNLRRTMGSTTANQFSSRSHALMQLTMERKLKVKCQIEEVVISKLSLIDLAGSERAAVTDNRGIRMQEGANINRSLLALGNVINILSDPNKKGAFVPYRDSKLTRLLKDSLGGNTFTLMIACVSPSYFCYEESVNTLKYASRAKSIKKKITQNVVEVETHISEYRAIIDSLKNEVNSLKLQLDLKLTNEKHSFQTTQDDDLQTLHGLEVFNEVGEKLFSNLEENWEIQQSINELISLKYQNEEKYNTLVRELKNPHIDQYQLNEEIQALTENMQNNEQIQNQLSKFLNKNLSDRKTLQKKFENYAESNKEIKQLKSACQLLNEQKSLLYNENQKIKQQALTLAQEKEKNHQKVLSMEAQMEQMKAQLKEKDKLIDKNNQLISELKKQKFTDSPSTQTLIDNQRKQSNEQRKSSTDFKNLSIEIMKSVNQRKESSESFTRNQEEYSNQKQKDVQIAPTKFYYKIPEQYIIDRQKNKEEEAPIKFKNDEPKNQQEDEIKQAVNLKTLLLENEKNEKKLRKKKEKPQTTQQVVNMDELKKFSQELQKINLEKVELLKRKKKKSNNIAQTNQNGKENYLKKQENQIDFDQIQKNTNQMSPIEKNNENSLFINDHDLFKNVGLVNQELDQLINSEKKQLENKQNPPPQKCYININLTKSNSNLSTAIGQINKLQLQQKSSTLKQQDIQKIYNTDSNIVLLQHDYISEEPYHSINDIQYNKKYEELQQLRSNQNKHLIYDYDEPKLQYETGINSLAEARNKLRTFKYQLNAISAEICNQNQITQVQLEKIQNLTKDFQENNYQISTSDEFLIKKLNQHLYDYYEKYQQPSNPLSNKNFKQPIQKGHFSKIQQNYGQNIQLINKNNSGQKQQNIDSNQYQKFFQNQYIQQQQQQQQNKPRQQSRSRSRSPIGNTYKYQTSYINQDQNYKNQYNSLKSNKNNNILYSINDLN